MLDTLRRLQRAGSVDALDVHVADLAARTAGRDEPDVQLAACLLSRHVADGHACLGLAALAGGPLFEDPAGGALAAPDLDRWRAALAASPVVGRGEPERPLVLDGSDRLYFRRHWHCEREVAARVMERAAAQDLDVSEGRLRQAVDRHLPAPAASPGQRLAAVTAALRPLLVLTGGPGSGKTTTVARLLAVLRDAAPPPAPGAAPRVALAAPTGKAAARLQAALREAGGGEIAATTVHRLVGLRPGGAARPVAALRAADVVVVDEASMVDLSLMAALLAGVAPGARLILIGDPHQLASVEAGAVLADLCADAAGTGDRFRARARRILGEDPPPGKTPSPLADSVVRLAGSHRFGERGGLGMLAAAVRDGDAGAALEVLGGGGDIAWLRPETPDAAARLVEGPLAAGYRDLLAAARAGAAPADLLERLGRHAVLCAHRGGPRGAGPVAARIEAALQRDGLAPAGREWYPGRPVLVTRNDHAARLFNGDVGVVVTDAGALRVAFDASDGPRLVGPGRLPEHETVFATTVHKSQGSEYGHVGLVLPDTPSAVLGRELLYTAVTRSRGCMTLVASAAVIRAAIERETRRFSGLRDALAAHRPAR